MARGSGTGAPSSVERDLAALGGDRVRGANALARAAIEVLARRLAPPDRAPEVPSAGTLRRWAAALERAQPAMGAFLGIADGLRGLARPGADAAERRRFVRAWRRRLRGENAAASRHARRLLARVERVVTLSRSDAVLRTLTARGRPWRGEVLVLRSRPGGEGALLARDLRGRGVRARVVEDREGPGSLGAASALLVGADALYADGSLVHKVGTRRMARAAAERRRPLWVVSGLSKLTARRRPSARLPKLFDRTPAREVTLYATDAGLLTARELGARSARRPARGSTRRGAGASLSAPARPSRRAPSASACAPRSRSRAAPRPSG